MALFYIIIVSGMDMGRLYAVTALNDIEYWTCKIMNIADGSR